ncbi:VCBS repeat-containing protein [Flavobacteriaceae bacterium]|nr:VCBS repeat-containing protein [Flavobacteriaceae bacterium]MDA8948555.1 VCBS repeat-containing protein [Flavobacteriaceae bacterium]MDA9016030.1 VCBS repeat-containing protein [Flavobacteriaceae bacterium]
MKSIVFYWLSFALVVSCAKPKTNLFELRKDLGVFFENKLTYTQDFNPYTYRNFYNGAGVALGDINNDGLLDIYMTGNLVDNKLLLNQGDWKFKDITNTAGVACKGVWSTGVTFADVNGDGLLDIYVCKSGKPGGENRHNELFINQGDLTFQEESKQFGLDVLGLSVHAAFFDADLDGDLDCYVLNNSLRSVGGYDLIKDQRLKPDPNGEGNKFFENKEGVYVDVSTEKGIYTSSIGFGLGITLSDFNNDKRPDLYISNDFFERDYFYLNKKGGFEEVLESHFQSISMGAMGADAADLNNDLLPDLFVTEMLPSNLKRQKLKAKYDSWDKYSLMNNKGYFHQFPRNSLQRNTGENQFFEISRFSGVAATEWSWASLIFDMDNDGLNDIFVANGIYKDLLDRDYLAYMANETQVQMLLENRENAIEKLIDIMPSEAVPNSAFKNKGEFQFEDKTKGWGLEQPSFSNGNAYGDLDNDGDLDLVINNVNMPSFFYENKTDTLSARSIKLKLKTDSKNTFAVGAKAIIYYDNGKQQMKEQFPSRGFQSSVANTLHFGLGNVSTIDSLIIKWPNGKEEVHHKLTTNITHEIQQQNSTVLNQDSSLTALEKESNLISLPFKHKENNWSEFNKERLIPHMNHNDGPAIATADINKDGVSDFYIGGGKNQTGALFISNKTTYKKIQTPFEKRSRSEDTDAVFFDGDNDGDLDLMITSGGKSFSKFSSDLDDRYYENTGSYNFVERTAALKFETHFSTSAIAVGDVNQDGYLDLIIGERFDLKTYGKKASIHLFINQGKGKFSKKLIPEFDQIGMITDLEITDINQDGWPDLVASGEWMPLSIWINSNGGFLNKTNEYGLSYTNGLWNTLLVKDLNGDHIPDIIGGNLGTNSFFKPGMKLFLNDFDQNGTEEQIICQHINQKYYPIVDKDELISQLPYLKKKIVKYENYANASIEDLFSTTQLEESQISELNTLKSAVFVSTTEGYVSHELPSEIQYAPVYAIAQIDKGNPSKGTLFFGGNQFLVKPQFGRYDASKGWVINYSINENKIDFEIPQILGVNGQIRQLKIVNSLSRNKLLIGINDNEAKMLNLTENK